MCSQLETLPETIVYATARDIAAASDLKALADMYVGRVEIVQLDMLSASSVKASGSLV
jgi:hypothetical protein